MEIKQTKSVALPENLQSLSARQPQKCPPVLPCMTFEVVAGFAGVAGVQGIAVGAEVLDEVGAESGGDVFQRHSQSRRRMAFRFRLTGFDLDFGFNTLNR